MGENTRSLRSIHLKNAEWRVELRENDVPGRESVICVRNDRSGEELLSLSESDFISVATLIMRADVELGYIKEHFKQGGDPKPREKKTALSEFALLPAVRDAVPYRVVSVKDRLVTLIVPSEKIGFVKRLMKKNGAKKMLHPEGTREGYVFSDQMEPPVLFLHGGLYYEIICQLFCVSLAPKTFIPLDQKIQEAVWEAPLERNGFAFLPSEEAWLYRLVTCLFRKRRFDEDDRVYFNENKDLLNAESLRGKLELVVFRFTSTLLDLIRDSAYDQIVAAYYSFALY